VATWENLFEGSDGTTVTTGNSGGASGTAWTATAGLVYKTDTFAQGASSAGVDNPGTGTALGRWALGSTDTAFSVRLAFRHTVATTGDVDLIEVRAPNDSTYLARLRLQGTNRLRLADSAGGFAWTSTSTLPVDTWHVISYYVTTGTTTANGTARAAYRVLGAGSWAEDSGTLTGNYGAGLQAGNLRLGKTSAGTYGGNLRFDTAKATTGADATGLLDPWAALTGAWQLGSIAMGV
jgi:hypothetical protein